MKKEMDRRLTNSPLAQVQFCSNVIDAEEQQRFLRLGDYFGTHFLMGGERFEISQPEAFLFGDNSDLDFLGTKPVMVNHYYLIQQILMRTYASVSLCTTIEHRSDENAKRIDQHSS